MAPAALAYLGGEPARGPGCAAPGRALWVVGRGRCGKPERSGRAKGSGAVRGGIGRPRPPARLAPQTGLRQPPAAFPEGQPRAGGWPGEGGKGRAGVGRTARGPGPRRPVSMAASEAERRWGRGRAARDTHRTHWRLGPRCREERSWSKDGKRRHGGSHSPPLRAELQPL